MTRAFGTARLHTFVVLAASGLLAALVTGRPELAALAAPFAVALIAGIAAAQPPHVTVVVAAESERVVQGDTVTVTATLTAPADTRPVEVLLEMPEGIEVVDPPGGTAWAVAVRAGEPRVVTATVVAREWGRHDIGRVVLRVRPALGLLAWEANIRTHAELRVLPDAGTLRRVVRPSETRNDNGSQVARALGDGIEFADIRPFRPGDRAGRVNWRVSARRGETYVNDQHPERNAEAVLLLDTFADDPNGESATLDRAVRSACSLATAMLAAHDRVGIVSLGGSTDWVTPGMGERARFVIVEHLLGSVARWTQAERSLRWLPPGVLPPRALVVVLSPLCDPRLLRAIVDIRRRGFDTTVVELQPALPPMGVNSAAGRLWRLERDLRRNGLEAVGVRVATMGPDDPLPLVVAELARARVRVGTARR